MLRCLLERLYTAYLETHRDCDAIELYCIVLLSNNTAELRRAQRLAANAVVAQVSLCRFSHLTTCLEIALVLFRP